ncbi:hypothetical protein FLL45_12860 [Aliikangiella marina]|uniref:Uncharacterized protein n=1 Tax=Aliikangiella marina TaxID=1712262 RepID=A0A545T981_9GAMM|nr:hypothetical protein [Aliikangiella marina]TQV73755.1 hypothetical protein FLL45_12860 [Aliikangiella marina]
MNKQSLPNDTADIEGFDSLHKQYQEASVELPSRDIDKQIIAAAHREIANPNPRKSLQISWWRRLLLPVYVAATFTFTAIAAHWFWPQEGTPAKTLPGTAPATVSFEVVAPQQMALERKESRQKRESQRRELPEPTMLMAPPETQSAAVTNHDRQVDALESGVAESEHLLLDSGVDGSVGDKSLTTSSSAARSEVHSGQLVHPEKEVWARQIIGMFREGEREKARKELVRFKQVYPDYPIDQQLEPFRH